MTEFEQTILGLFQYAVLVAGLSYYLTGSVIFASLRVALVHVFPWRVVAYFVYCPMCVGTWISAALIMLGVWPLYVETPLEVLYALTTGVVANLLTPHGMPADHPAYRQEAENDQTEEG